MSAEQLELSDEGHGRTPGLLILTAAVFVAVTTELLPLGLLPSISTGLDVTQARVGLLVTTYAFVVAISAVPLTRITLRLPRKPLFITVLVGYSISSAAVTVSDAYLFTASARLTSGLCHAIFFSMVTPFAARLVPRNQAGRAVAVVYAGISFASVLGVPLGTALGTATGWRTAFGVLAVLALLVAVLAIWLLPDLEHTASSAAGPSLSQVLCTPGVTAVAVTTAAVILGQFTFYTYITPIMHEVGLTDAWIPQTLFVIGMTGVVGLWLAGVTADRAPHGALVASLCLIVVSLIILSIDGVATSAAVIALSLWGMSYGALSTFFNAAALRVAPEAPYTATAIVNSSFNMGIGGGALIGAFQIASDRLESLPTTAAALTTLGLIVVLLYPGAAFPHGKR